MKKVSFEKESKNMILNSSISSSDVASTTETVLNLRRWKALGLLSLAQFLVILDT
jgi:hypothetical protein